MEVEIVPGGWNLPCGQVFNLEHLISCSRYKNIAGIFGGSVTKWRDNWYMNSKSNSCILKVQKKLYGFCNNKKCSYVMLFICTQYGTNQSTLKMLSHLVWFSYTYESLSYFDNIYIVQIA